GYGRAAACARPARPRCLPRRGVRAEVRGVSALTASEWISRAESAQARTQRFIDGRYVPAASGQTYDDIAGRDGRVITQVAQGGVEDIDRAVAAARASFEERRWAAMAP